MDPREILPRRRRIVLAMASAGTIPGLASAAGRATAMQETFPDRPVTIVVPFSAGGFTDTMSRVLGKSLGEKWKTPVVVENRQGAGGNIGAAHVARAKPDGYTLLVANTATNAINGFLYSDMGFDPDRDFAPVAMLARTPNVMVVDSRMQAQDVPAFLKAAREGSGIFYGSAGNGTTSHLTGVLFAGAAGLDSMTHVPFRGSSEVMTALQSGVVQVAFDNIVAWAPLVRAGRVRALAVTGENRSVLLPGVPTLAEAGIADVQSYSWFGLVAPAGTPAAVIQQINHAANDVVGHADFTEKLPGAEVSPGSPADFAAFMDAEKGKWGKLITELELKPD